MNVHTLHRKQFIPQPRSRVFAFFEAPENLVRLTPAWLGFHILTPSPVTMGVGALIDYTIRWLGIPVRWRTLITAYDPPLRFVDEQIKGPYSLWHHSHTFEEVSGGTQMVDEVHFSLPFGFLGDIAHGLVVRRQLEQIFDYRSVVIDQLLRGDKGTIPSARQLQLG